jgi:hypothetical protein
MLVATALVIFIMVILTQAFGTGMDALRQLKTIGDMQEKLRTASIIISRDLAGNHITDTNGPRTVSGFNWSNGPPTDGFFRIWHGTGPLNAAYGGYEGIDGDQLPSYRVTDHILHFTVNRATIEAQQGIHRPDFASAVVPAGSPLPALVTGTTGNRFQDVANLYNYQLYEVAYFLSDLNQKTPGGLERYALIRRQKLLVPHPDSNGTDVNDVTKNPVPANAANIQGYSEVSCNTNPLAANAAWLYFNNSNDITVPERRFAMDPNNGIANGGIPIKGGYPLISAQDATKAGSDLLLTDVLSFQVMVLFSGQTTFTDLYSAASQNTNFQAAPRVYDTWSQRPIATDGVYDYSGWATPNTATSLPIQTPITALQITIRIWDVKSQLTRQITFVVQNM